MKYVVWGLVVLLIIAHQDNWYWEDSTLVFGFFPITLLYHAGISVVAGVTWYLATKFAWPDNIDSWTQPAAAMSAGEQNPQSTAGSQQQETRP